MENNKEMISGNYSLIKINKLPKFMQKKFEIKDIYKLKVFFDKKENFVITNPWEVFKGVKEEKAI